MEAQAIFIIFSAAALVVLSAFVFYRLGKRGFDAGSFLTTADAVAQTAGKAFEAVRPFLPAGPAVPLVSAVLQWAQRGVDAAEQLYRTSQIEGDSRRAEAEKFIRSALAATGIELTPEIETVIGGAVESAVALLPKTHDPEGNII